MSREYDMYIQEHKDNVSRAFQWMEEHLPQYSRIVDSNVDLNWQICLAHDESKTSEEEYKAYDNYFYGNNRSFDVMDRFDKAWLHHIHSNPHHWQHWVLLEDDPEGGSMVMKTIDMPTNYIIEMICDWWSFSWKVGNLYTIFNWYDEHKATMKLSGDTRAMVEAILASIKKELDGEKNE